MCGICAYVGNRSASDVILDGLKRLEYRGYDSAGIAVAEKEGLARQRSVGRIADLLEKLDGRRPEGNIGVGHTRWATHGDVTEANAHPHVDASGTIALVHNGIVENYRELKQELLDQGVRFASQTDSEVIVQLVGHYRLLEGCSLVEAMRRAMGRLEGNNAVVALCLTEPELLVAARKGSAGGLVVGFGEGENYVASDIPALLPYTQRMLFVGDGELVSVTTEEVDAFDLSGEPLAKEAQTISWAAEAASKGTYDYYMLKEIHEQPGSSRTLIEECLADGGDAPRLEGLSGLKPVLPHLQRLHAIACGTAWHACLVAKFLIERLARLPVEADYGSEFRYREPLLAPGSVVLVITQSGETADTLAAMEIARRQGMQSIALVNVVGSQAARRADSVVPLCAGPEIGVASTKAFTSQVLAAALLAVYLGRLRGELSAARGRALCDEMRRLPDLIHRVLQTEEQCRQIAQQYADREDFLYLGRGISYPIALEGALKLKEISYIHAEGYPAGEMKHGPIALIGDEMPVVAVCPQDHVRSKMLSNIEQVKARGGKVIAVACERDREVAEKADHVIWVPETVWPLSPILSVIPLQLLAYHMAILRGCDVDKPRNLAKSVTVE